ncbi:hypothetical protein EON65_45705 [archaeon]|nr:MAG: hypothetical protein EON65_45705 [archaeon]
MGYLYAGVCVWTCFYILHSYPYTHLQPSPPVFPRWTQVLRWVPVTRLQQSWAEFCGDQVKMQGVEAMQKQLLIREKRSE